MYVTFSTVNLLFLLATFVPFLGRHDLELRKIVAGRDRLRVYKRTVLLTCARPLVS